MTKGEDNLIPLNKRTKDEQREISRMGGVASGEARRRKATIKKTLETILGLEVPGQANKLLLESLGLEPSMQNAVVLQSIMAAINDANPRNLEALTKLLGQDKSLQDKREQTERIKRMQAETERLQHDMAVKTGEVGKEESEAQTIAIADLINSPAETRDIKDFLYQNNETEEVADDD